MSDNQNQIGPGTVINDKFEVREKVKTGSVGDDVFLGYHKSLNREILVRIMPPMFSYDQDLVQRFLREIKLTASLQHPNILPAFEAGEFNNQYFLVTAYEKGFYLNEYLEQRGQLGEKEAVKLIIPIIKAMKYVWDKSQILHRNIRPETILIARDNVPLLTDFGMAKSTASGATHGLTMEGFTIGNPQYMSPEQVKAERNLNFHSDMYCLGLIFYEMLAGHPPFIKKSQIELMDAQLTEQHAAVYDMNHDVSMNCSLVVDKMLEKEPEDRYQDWDEIIQDLDNILNDQPPAFVSGKTSGKKRKKKKTKGEDQKPTRNKTVIALVVVTVLIIIVLGLGVIVLGPAIDNKDSELKNIDDEIEKINPKPTEEISTEPKTEEEDVPKKEPEKIEKKPEENVKKKKDENKTKGISSQLKKVREQEKKDWAQAEKVCRNAMKNPKNFDQAITLLNKIKEKYPDSKYFLMANAEINNLEEAKNKAAGKVMSRLEDLAKPLVAKKQYRKAAGVLLNYEGNFASETKEKRKKLADIYLFEAEIVEKAEDNKKKEIAEKKKSLLYSLTGKILKGKPKSAFEDYEMSNDRDLLPKAKKILDDLQNAEKNLVNSFEDDIGKEIAVDSIDGIKAIKITEIKGKKIYIEEKFGKATIKKKLNLRKFLSCEEKSKRLGSINKQAKAIYIGVDEYRNKNSKAAKKHFGNAGIFEEVLIERMKKSK